MEVKFKQINDAYNILKDDEARKEYDKKLAATQEKLLKTSKHPPTQKPFNVNDLGNSFESFFGFNAKTGDITNDQKLKNPLDTSSMFDKFMGFNK